MSSLGARLPLRTTSSAGQLDPLENEGELRGLERLDRQGALGQRSMESAKLEPLRPHREAVAVPIDDANAITPAREEDVEVPGQRVMDKNGANDCRQAVRAFASIDCLNSLKLWSGRIMAASINWPRKFRSWNMMRI